MSVVSMDKDIDGSRDASGRYPPCSHEGEFPASVSAARHDLANAFHQHFERVLPHDLIATERAEGGIDEQEPGKFARCLLGPFQPPTLALAVEVERERDEPRFGPRHLVDHGGGAVHRHRGT